MVIKAINMAKKRFETQAAAAPPPAPPPSEVYLKEIRDALTKK
jgi:large conductance mechanosensitive channel